ncbi:hypothetical protein IC582_001000 [Cucumis melo]
MSGQSTAVHIVYTERPHNEEPEAYHIRTLASVLGRSVFSSTSRFYSVAVKTLLGRLLCIAIKMLLVASLLGLRPIRLRRLPNNQEFCRLSKAVIISCILEEEQQGFIRRTPTLPGNIGLLPR